MKLLPKTRWSRIRVGILCVLLVLVIGRCAMLPRIRAWGYRPRAGDVVFQAVPPFALVRAIQGATGSPYSHCGVVIREDGRWKVAESMDHVRKTLLHAWIARGRGSRFAAYRLRPPYRKHIRRFVAELEPFMGRPYDFRYRLDDAHLYCSELVYKAYRNATGEELGRLVRLGELDWRPYEDTIRRYEDGPPPLDRRMITPKHLSQAEQLERVHGFEFGP